MLNELKAKFSLKNLLDNKRFTIPFSICVAFILWLIIMINQNPIRQQTFNDISVNVSLENTVVGETGLGIINDVASQKFTVVLSGPNDIVSSLKPEDFILNAEVAEVTAAGTYKLNVVGARNSGKSGYTFANISPATVEVTFDFIDTKEYTVTPKLVGVGAAEGLVAETPIINGLENGMITIKGPRTVMDKINSVVAYAEINKTLDSTQTFDANILAYDEKGATLDMTNLVLDNPAVKVSVPISKKVTLPVNPSFNNLPSGLALKNIKYAVDHNKVTVVGPPDVISKMTSVTLSPIDFTSVSASSNKFEVSLVLPDGVKLLDNIEVFIVSIDTKGYAEKTLTVSNIRFTGLANSVKAKTGKTIKNVKICGPKADIKKIKASDLYAVIDLTDKTAGEYTVDIQIKSQKYNKVWQVGTYSVAVTVE